jgi:predicted  nucleic acid-binding Zn-ribbon protein
METDMASEPVRELDTKLAALRAAAKSLREQRPSWFEHIFHPGRHARRQEDFSAAVVATVQEIAGSMRNATAQLAEKEREISELKKEIAQGREEQKQVAAEAAGTIQNLAEARQQIDQLARDHSEKIEQLGREIAGAHRDLSNELRERIQHLLDEQRVAIRQLSLKASEDAILSDRARRATELKIEELAKRLPRPPA